MMGERDDTPIATAVNNAVEKATNVEGQISDVFHYPDALTLEEIAASTDLTNKLPSASAVSELNSSLERKKITVSNTTNCTFAGEAYKCGNLCIIHGVIYITNTY